MMPSFAIGSRRLGAGEPAFIVAEMSANHDHRLDVALDLVRAAHRAGADAIKLQTYTPDTMTIACDREEFRVSGTLWNGRLLHDLYGEAQTPWEWHAPVQALARELGLEFFSTPFDASAVDYLEQLGVPVHKVASFELIDIPLLERIGATGKPVIASTGMATVEEIEEAVATLRRAGCADIVLLKCTSAYPSKIDDMNLRTIADMAARFGVLAGLSDHSMTVEVPVTAVALGACVIEKHMTLSRAAGGPDSAFSLEPSEFAAMVQAVRAAERALGVVQYGATGAERASLAFRRSLFAVEDIAAGEPFTPRNVRCIRPGHGLHPRHLAEITGRPAAGAIARGTPLRWDHVGR